MDAAGREGRIAERAAHPVAVLNGPPETNATLEANLLAGNPLSVADAREITRLAREEMARTVEDVLARRTRVLFLDAKRAGDAARPVAEALAITLGRDSTWIDTQLREFTALARKYLPTG